MLRSKIRFGFGDRNTPTDLDKQKFLPMTEVYGDVGQNYSRVHVIDEYSVTKDIIFKTF